MTFSDKLILGLLIMLSLISCGVAERYFCSRTSNVTIEKSYRSYATWHCGVSGSRIEITEPYAVQTMIHELIHVYTEVPEHLNIPSYCFFGQTHINKHIYWWSNYEQFPPCPEEVNLMLTHGEHRTMYVYNLSPGDKTFERNIQWAIGYWNYWLGYEAFRWGG